MKKGSALHCLLWRPSWRGTRNNKMNLDCNKTLHRVSSLRSYMLFLGFQSWFGWDSHLHSLTWDHLLTRLQWEPFWLFPVPWWLPRILFHREIRPSNHLLSRICRRVLETRHSLFFQDRAFIAAWLYIVQPQFGPSRVWPTRGRGHRQVRLRGATRATNTSVWG